MRLDKTTIIGDILDADNSCEAVFLSEGMSCMGCPAARGETVEEACEVHQVDIQRLLDKLSAHFQSK